MTDALKALRRADFDWTAHTDGIWSASHTDVVELQVEARRELSDHVEDLAISGKSESPSGIPMVGPGGSGKTHLLGFVRRQAVEQGLFFVLGDMTDVRDFWETLLLGYLRSLQQPGQQGRRQLDTWLDRMLSQFGAEVRQEPPLPEQRPPGLINSCNALIAAVRKAHAGEAQEHQDVLRALVLFACDHAELNDLGYKWLQGIGIDDEERHHHGFREAQRSPARIVRGLSWLLSLQGPTLLALDQLDAIVAEHNLAGGDGSDDSSEQQRLSLAIIEGIAGGLMALRDVTRRTLTVVSTLEATWTILCQRAATTWADRFQEPLLLAPVASAAAMQQLVAKRLHRAYEAEGFTPPYQSYPFGDGYFEKYRANTPRELLKACDQHRRHCRKAGRVEETHGGFTMPGPQPPQPSLDVLRQRFLQLKQEADVAAVLKDESENQLDCLVETACAALLVENPLASQVLARVDSDFLGTGNYDPLHARIRLILTHQGERERHHAFRFLQKEHHRSFQARLKAAITASGIDHDLGFRRLTVLRRGPVPSGAATAQLVKEFHDRGGCLVDPSDDDLAALWAISQLREEDGFEDWLEADRMVSNLPSFSGAAQWLFESKQVSGFNTRRPPPAEAIQANAVAVGATSRTSSATPKENSAPAALAAPTPPSNFDQKLPLGRRLVSGQPDSAVCVPVGSLANHSCVLAGSGSGKTVFLRRIIEEAALLGMPSIVIDGANDLSRLGDPWPQRPEAWTDEDATKADGYHTLAEVIVWTPGIQSGNPLVLDPIPDFAAIRAASSGPELDDDLESAVNMAVSSLAPLVAPGNSGKAKKSRAVLIETLRFFARRGGGSLSDLIGLLQEPPDEAIAGFGDGDKIAQNASELLLSAAKLDPLLKGNGVKLDPAVLLKGTSERTRVSVINLSGLQGIEAQQLFLNQLAMTLFTWIKKHPASTGSLRGLLVLDEAKDFVPSGKSVPGKDNLIRLVAQARKYGLGMLFATQAPKSIDHNVVANCSTLLVGRANSPAAIDTVQDLLRSKGGSGTDVAKLARGTFYLSTYESARPVKIATSLCLSHHPSSPPDESEVIEKAQRSRTASSG